MWFLLGIVFTVIFVNGLLTPVAMAALGLIAVGLILLGLMAVLPSLTAHSRHHY